MSTPTLPPINVKKARRKRRTDPLESTIERAVCKYAESKGLLQYKFTSPGKRSVPDRMFLTPWGEIFFIEFKRLGEKPTPSQLREHEKLRAHGYDVYVIDNINEGKGVIFVRT